jgi:hypothetical protein
VSDFNEKWRPARGYEGIYEVSTEGRLWSVCRKRIKRPYVRKNGYVQHTLTRGGRQRSHYLHRLVVEAFRGSIPEGLQCNHKSGVKGDCRLSNLEVVTRRANMAHARRMGLLRPLAGVLNGRATVSEAQVLAMRRMHEAGQTVRQIAEEMQVPWGLAYKAIRRITWRHLAA